MDLLNKETEARMRAAMEQAQQAAEAGEVPVGAVVYAGGALVATGQNRVLRDLDPTAHAEVVAMRMAARALGNYRLTGCALYVTLEPCAMCAGAMVHARLGSLAFGALDPKAGAAGSVLGVLNHSKLNHRMEIEGGVLGHECGALLQAFFRARRPRRISTEGSGELPTAAGLEEDDHAPDG